MGENETAKAGLVVGTSAAIATAVLALMSRNRSNNIVSLDDATMQLLIAIANQTGKIDDIITAINNLALGGGGAGYAPNADTFKVFTVPCQATGIAYQLPDYEIPDDFAILVTSNLNNTGTVYVAQNQADCLNVNQAYALLPSSSVVLKIKNSKSIWVSSTVAGDLVNCIMEVRTS